MISFRRAISGIKSIYRAREIFTAFCSCQRPLITTLAYLQLVHLEYPYVIHLHNGLRFELADWHDLTTAWVVLFGGEYEVLENDNTIVDLGANIGIFCLLASQTNTHAKVIAVEPFPENYERLIKNVIDNDRGDFVTTINAAAVGVEGDRFMAASNDVPGHSKRTGAAGDVRVKGVTLQTLMEDTCLDEIDFLKVDIEGGEYELFEHCPPEVLKKIRRIGLEYHGGGNTAQLFSKILSEGFRVRRHARKGSAGVVDFLR